MDRHGYHYSAHVSPNTRVGRRHQNCGGKKHLGQNIAAASEKSSLCDPEVLLQTPNPEKIKDTKTDSKVTFGAPAKVTQKLLKSDF